MELPLRGAPVDVYLIHAPNDAPARTIGPRGVGLQATPTSWQEYGLWTLITGMLGTWTRTE